MDKRKVVSIHLLCWLLLILSQALPGYWSGNYPLWKACVITTGFLVVAAECFYGSYGLVAKQLFTYKHYWKTSAYIFLLLTGLVVTRYWIEFYFFKPVLGYDNYKRVRDLSLQYYITNVFLYYFPGYFLYGLIYYFIENWYLENQRKQAISKEQLGSELAFLRAQINPHFLFNTINDIYTLAYQKSDHALVALLKLSELLRYMLRDGQQELVPLRDDVSYMENLAELQRISACGEAYIVLKTIGIKDQLVAPLLFVAFVENAFKHGVWDDLSNPILIFFIVENGYILFSCKNKKHFGLKDTLGGMGLTNVQRRLQLLYPDRHELTISDTDDWFGVQLKLEV